MTTAHDEHATTKRVRTDELRPGDVVVRKALTVKSVTPFGHMFEIVYFGGEIDHCSADWTRDILRPEDELNRLRAALRTVREIVTSGKVFSVSQIVAIVDEALGEKQA